MNIEFSVGDHVYVRVRAKKSSLELGSCAKLSSRYCGLFEVVERIGPVAYRFALFASTRVQNVFHVSLLKKMEQEVANIRQNLKAFQDRKKIYVEKHRVHREFSVGDHFTLE